MATQLNAVTLTRSNIFAHMQFAQQKFRNIFAYYICYIIPSALLATLKGFIFISGFYISVGIDNRSSSSSLFEPDNFLPRSSSYYYLSVNYIRNISNNYFIFSLYFISSWIMLVILLVIFQIIISSFPYISFLLELY